MARRIIWTVGLPFGSMDIPGWSHRVRCRYCDHTFENNEVGWHKLSVHVYDFHPREWDETMDEMFGPAELEEDDITTEEYEIPDSYDPWETATAWNCLHKEYL